MSVMFFFSREVAGTTLEYILSVIGAVEAEKHNLVLKVVGIQFLRCPSLAFPKERP